MERRHFLQTAGLAVLGASAPIAYADRAKEETPKHEFVHPGIFQSADDLVFMKSMVEKHGEPVWSAWERMLKRPTASLDFHPEPHAHVFRGSGGIERSGSTEFIESGQAAHFHALQWYATKDPRHAEKVIEILDAWSSSLWDFSGNDAKLTAGWVGGYLCSAAEIVLTSYPSWKSESQNRFKQLLAEVFVPLLHPFFPEANGNWDGAIMFTLASIAVHLEDRALFDRVVDHYLYGTGNAGILKYVWPSGQCEETTRDQGHVQLGLGYFSFAAQVLSVQGVDAFAAADCRLGLGFEYTSAYMLGEDPFAFGNISERLRGHFEDYYEAALAQYLQRRIALPYTQRAAERARENGSVSAVWLYRAHTLEAGHEAQLQPNRMMEKAGADDALPLPQEEGWLRVPPGNSFDQLLEQPTPQKKIILLAGKHELTRPFTLTSGISIQGSGRATIVHSSAPSGEACFLQGEPELNNVLLKNFVIEGDPNPVWPLDPNEEKRHRSSPLALQRAGVLLQGNRENEITNIRLENLTVRNCTMSGVAISGANHVAVTNCDLSENGGSGAPGPGLHSNLQLTHVHDCRVEESRLTGSMWGSGIAAVHSEQLSIKQSELSRNKRFGVELLNCTSSSLTGNLFEANDEASYKTSSTTTNKDAVRVAGNTETLNGNQRSRRNACEANYA